MNQGDEHKDLGGPNESPKRTYKEGPTLAKCLLGLVMVLCCIYLMPSCRQRRMSYTFYIGREPEADLGGQYYDEGKYQEAADWYQKKVDEIVAEGKRYDPKYGPLYGNLGMAYYRLGEYDQAIRYLEECAGVDERTANIEELAWDYDALGNVYKAAGDLDEAIRFYEKGLKAVRKASGEDSEDAAVFLSDLGDTYRKNKEYEKSLDRYQQALKIREHNGADLTWTHIRIARIYNDMEDYENAEAFYKKAALSETGDSFITGVAYYNLGQMYQNKGDYSSSFSPLSEALGRINQDKENDYAESCVHSALAASYAETEPDLVKAIEEAITACRLLEQSESLKSDFSDDLEEYREQLKGYYQTDTEDMGEEGFEVWYQEQMKGN